MPDRHQFSWFGLVFLAMLAATATVGVRIGSLWPIFPTITRKETPRRFWIGVGLFALIVILNVANLLWGAF